jgi:hypothetical protein
MLPFNFLLSEREGLIHSTRFCFSVGLFKSSACLSTFQAAPHQIHKHRFSHTNDLLNIRTQSLLDYFSCSIISLFSTSSTGPACTHVQGVRRCRASKNFRSQFKILKFYNITYILFILIKYQMCINRLILRL